MFLEYVILVLLLMILLSYVALRTDESRGRRILIRNFVIEILCIVFFICTISYFVINRIYN